MSGREVSVGARAFDLLVALIERRDRVVSKEELLTVVLAWAGGRRGRTSRCRFRHCESSSVRSHWRPSQAGATGSRGCSSRPKQMRQWCSERSRAKPKIPHLPLPEKPSIAVLPFANLSANPEHRFFADGVTQDIVSALSRFHSLFVIAHASTATYLGANADMGTVAAQLGVRYVVSGSVRVREGDRVRVSGAADRRSVKRKAYMVGKLRPGVGGNLRRPGGSDSQHRGGRCSGDCPRGALERGAAPSVQPLRLRDRVARVGRGMAWL